MKIRLKDRLELSVVLALIVFSCTVAPVLVMAEDSTIITNSVITSTNSGGKSGVDGTDGKDGQPGQSGQSGSDGASVINIDSSAKVWVESTINGQKTIDIHKTKETVGEAVAVVKTNLNTSSTDVVTQSTSSNTDEEANAKNLTTQEVSQIKQVFYSIRLMILKYVSTLF